MSNQIDRAGPFRGRILEHTVNATKNGFPQFVARYQATEMFDENVGEWVAWDYDQQIIGYHILFSNKGPCLNHEQVQRATGWNGAKFSELAEMDLSDKIVQFRVEEDTYEGNTSLKVQWLDAADASPSRTLKKLDAKALKDLDAKFGSKAPTTPAKAPAKPPAHPTPPISTPKPVKDAQPTAPDAQVAPTEPTPAPKRGPGRPKKAATTPAPDPAANPLGDSCTKEEAWTKICELKTDDCTDHELKDAWIAAADEVAGSDTDEADITPEQWAKIRDITLDKIPSLPF